MTNTKAELKVTISEGNAKMGSVKSISLPAIKSCRKDCGCCKICYACRGHFLFGNVKKSIDMNWEVLNTNPKLYWDTINEALLLNRYFRFHVSGDIPNAEYITNLVKAAKKNRATQILIFTKRYPMVNAWIKKNGMLPKNIHMIYSKWKGMAMPNPYNFPEAHILYEDCTTTADDGAKLCTGSCVNCIKTGKGCWNLKPGEQVLIKQH